MMSDASCSVLLAEGSQLQGRVGFVPEVREPSLVFAAGLAVGTSNQLVGRHPPLLGWRLFQVM